MRDDFLFALNRLNHINCQRLFFLTYLTFCGFAELTLNFMVVVGKKIANYKVLEKIGGGGMGVVYKALDEKLERPVALKFLPERMSTESEAKTRFIQEAKMASSLDHTNICTIYEIGEQEEGRLFIAMAFYEGETLKKKIARGPLPIVDALDIALQMARGLHAAHAAGIVHRDIKPANVIVTTDGVVKIVDFGLAKMSGSSHLTKTGTTVGTVAYMSPEQAHGEETDHRTDLWSLGVVVYEMLTGRRPFEGNIEQAILYSILYEAPTLVTTLRPDISASLGSIVEKMLRKAPAERYQHAHEVLADLQAIKTGPVLSVVTEKQSSIAVLPFENMSADPEQDYFCDGLAEELINALTKLNNLRVIARTSTFSFKGQYLDVREIGRKLGVETILEGSVRKAGNRLRITAQLVIVADGSHLWSERFDRVMEDVFAIQDEISLAIAEKLRVDSIAHEKAAMVKRYTENMEAYRLYLKGRHFWNQRTEQSLKKATSFFEQAIEKDPDYALAHVGIADCFMMRGVWGFIPAAEVNASVRTAAMKALDIDSMLAEGYTSLGFWKTLFSWDWPAAELDFKRALEINPQNIQTRYWYGIHLTLTSRFDEAVMESKRAMDLDPLSPTITTFLGMALCYGRRYDEAIEILSKTLEIDSNFYPAHFFLGITRASEGNFEEAIYSFQKAANLSQETPAVMGHLGFSYAMAGRKNEALDILERLRSYAEDRYVSPINRAMIFAGLGEQDQALEEMELAWQIGEPFIVHARVTPMLDVLRSDVRFLDLISRVRART